jgi:toxin ParE1/3/4
MAVVVKRPQAEADLDEIFDYLAEYSLERAVTFLWDLNRTMENLAVNPFMGRKRDELLPGLRSFLHEKYVIFYFPASNGIDVIRILHGARDIEKIFSTDNW